MDIETVRQVFYFTLVIGLCLTAANKDDPLTALTDTVAIVFVVAGATQLQ